MRISRDFLYSKTAKSGSSFTNVCCSFKVSCSCFTSKAGGFRILSRIRLGIEIWNEQVFSNFKGGKLLGTSVPNKPLKGRKNERRTCGTASES